jgi:hypothetical protein
MCKSGASFQAAGQKLADSLQGPFANAGSSDGQGGIGSGNTDKEAVLLRSWYNSMGETAPSMRLLSEEILRLAAAHSRLMISVEASVCVPLEQFAADSGPLGELISKSRSYHRSIEEYETTLAKMLHGEQSSCMPI